MENIDSLKGVTHGRPTYRLSNANVFTSPSGYHYIDYLDPVEDISPEIDETALTDEIVVYIEKSLQSNSERFEKQASIVKNYLSPIRRKRILDVGCGGGLFLSKLANEDATLIGVELSDSRAQYARKKHDLEIIKRPVEDSYWQSRQSTFDAITLWDVIEHVNYPLLTLKSCSNILKSGGYLFIDTPCRDSFYHRFGEITYKLSNGKYPTFLNSMYSAHQFGHKQIFSTSEMKQLFEEANIEVVELRKFHELSFPYSFYLKKLFKSNLMVKLSLPIVKLLLWIFPVKNKMLVVGRKR
jgi:2-polyprenyl-6-hydroxyphenyl methylase/3-demethylubiquinone-9 3-methyltransferase